MTTTPEPVPAVDAEVEDAHRALERDQWCAGTTVSHKTMRGLLAALTASQAEAAKLRGRAEKAEDVLRSLASWLGVGGYNAPEVDAEAFERKIREGVEITHAPQVEAWRRYNKLRGIGAAPNGTLHLEKGLVMVATNLDKWLDKYIETGLPPAPAHAVEFSAETEALRSRDDFHTDPVEQLAFELAAELEDAELNRNDLVTLNREKLRGIAKRIMARALAAETEAAALKQRVVALEGATTAIGWAAFYDGEPKVFRKERDKLIACSAAYQAIHPVFIGPAWRHQED